MRKVLICLAMIFLCSNTLASAYDDYDFNAGYDLNVTQDNNSFSSIGETIIRGAFGGDYILFSLLLLLCLVMTMYQAKLSSSAAVVVGITTFLALSLFIYDTASVMFTLLGVIIAIFIVVAITKVTRG